MSVVYFIGAGSDNNPIKIGYADNVERRLKALQVSHWMRLNLLGFTPGGRELEAELHERFKHLHVRGEWFWRHIDLEREISRLSIAVKPSTLDDNASLLVEWMSSADLSNREAAPLFGITESALSLLLSRKRSVSLRTAVMIERVTGGAVPLHGWLSDTADTNE